MDYIAVHLFTADAVIADMLTGQLTGLGFSGFEGREDRLVAYVAAAGYPGEEAVCRLVEPLKIAFETERVAGRNWNAEWEASFSPVIVGDFCAVRAGFHRPVPGVTHDIVITPRMTFGTGHHPTTASVIRLMAALDLSGKTVLDFGTGTGILAILAVRMGAHKVTGIDIDPSAVENARENARENGLQPEQREAASFTAGLLFLQADDPAAAPASYDCILANIHLRVILTFLPALASMLAPGGVLLASGILRQDVPEMLAAAAKAGLKAAEQVNEQGWVALMWRKKEEAGVAHG
jgi:ribosomal protein L11 methyltransferase